MLKITESRLIRRAKAGDAAAVEALIRAHQGSLFAFLLRLSGRPDVAEDMVQEAFVRVLRSIDRFDTRFRFSTWLFTIARRLYVNHLQKHRPTFDNERILLADDPNAEPGGATARDEARRHLRDVIDEAMLVVTPLQREIILLFHQQGWSVAEIGLHLSMPEGTVKSHLHRGRRRMQRAIAADPVASVWARESLP